MTLTDAGPLIALLAQQDPNHDLCVGVLDQVERPLVTTEAAFAEAMHLLGRYGWPAQELLWTLFTRHDLEIGELDGPSMARARQLMKRYRDLPMDLADATLVALAEQRDIKRIFTLDKDFRVYRLHGRTAFEIIPEL